VSIRYKVILPFLVLTLIVAITGVYVVTRLVANSLSERLTNQLLEAGRVVSDDFARQEIKHVENARYIALTRGVDQALQAKDVQTLESLVRPAAAGLGMENLILLDANGRQLLQLLRQPDGTYLSSSQTLEAAGSSLASDLLAPRNPDSLPRRAILANPTDGRTYFYTSMAFSLDNQATAILAVGTSLETLLPYLKTTSLADVILYDAAGRAIGTTFATQSSDAQFLKNISIPADLYQKISASEGNVSGQNFQLEGRWYSLGRSPIRISSDRIGAFAVVLPLDFVIQPGTMSRNNTLVLFTAAVIAVVAIGTLISQLITRPLFSLVRTSQAIAGGDLDQRTGIRSRDEIGTLATTFDAMTEHLQQRTLELERANATLEKMDASKTSFIQVSAHELRTPLTVISAYTQILEKKAADSPELESVSKGILQGIDRMNTVVNSMLDISRIDSNTLKVIPEDVRLDALLKQVQDTFAAALEERHLKLKMSGLKKLPAIYADPDLLQKVFYHLVMNAIKYTPDGGAITVSGRLVEADSAPAEVEIVVGDTGIGIDPQYLELIFEKFYQTGEVQLHSSGKTNFKGGGPGLGLAIARGIVEAHGGHIWAESPGHNEATCPGSRFFVRLPVKWEKQDERQPKETLAG
jgi:signal transduction histidine kinase